MYFDSYKEDKVTVREALNLKPNKPDPMSGPLFIYNGMFEDISKKVECSVDETEFCKQMQIMQI